MSLLKRLVEGLFIQPSKEEENEVIKEEFAPSQFFLMEYEQWKEAGLHQDLLRQLKENYAFKKSNPDADLPFFIHESKESNGFYFLAEEEWSNKEYSFIVHYIKELLTANGYVCKNSVRSLKEEKDKSIHIESFYFKLPAKSRLISPYPQLWGNISIEHKLIDEQSHYVKLMATTYNDSSYDEAEPFDDLVDLIFAD